MKRRWILSVLLTWICLPVRAADFGDISVRVELLSPGSNERGYQEYRATIINHSPAQTRRVTLVFPDQVYRLRGNAIREMTRTVEVAPQATVVVSLFQPPLALLGAGIRVLIDDREQYAALPFTFGDSSVTGHRGAGALVLASEEIVKHKVLDSADEALRDSSGVARFDYVRVERPVTEWSQHWLSYTRYDGLIVMGAEMHAMPDPVRQALLRYVESGGTLLVFGKWEAPRQWQGRHDSFSASDVFSGRSASPAPATYATPAPMPTPTPVSRPVPAIKVTEALQTYYVGFGLLLLLGDQSQPALTTDQWRLVESRWQDQMHYYSEARGRAYLPLETLNYQLPVVEKFNTPVRGLFLLMLLFVVVIGPLNLLILARRRKKLWLLWTVPVISLLTCFAVAAYAVVSEGITGYARTECLTILDEQEHRATTIGFTGYYSPLTPSDGLHFGYDIELTPAETAYVYYSGRGGTPRSLDWTTEQHLVSGWITARVPAYFRVRKSETRRERLAVSLGLKGEISVVNGLGAPIRKLWLATKERKLFEGQDLAPGAALQLAPSDKLVGQDRTALRSTFTNEWFGKFTDIEDKPEQYLLPGTYIAILEEASFIEPGLRNASRRKGKTIVYGIQGEK